MSTQNEKRKWPMRNPIFKEQVDREEAAKE